MSLSNLGAGKALVPKSFDMIGGITVFSNTWDANSFMMFGDKKEMLMPGEHSKVTLKLYKPMVMEVGQRFTVRAGSTTIGTGKITAVSNMESEEREFTFELSKKNKEKMMAKKQEQKT